MSTSDATGTVTPLHGSVEHDTPHRVPPHNLDAEIALIGAILANNRSYEKVYEFLKPENFVDPAHARIFAACATLIDRGQLADATTLANYFEHDETLAEVGGAGYLQRLQSAVVTVQNARDLGRLVYDLFLRRELIDIGGGIVNTAFDQDLDLPAPKQIEQAEERLFGLAERGHGERGFIEFRTAAIRAIDAAEAAYRRDSHLVGVATGFTRLDEMLGGLHKSDLVIVAGRPSMGKTSFATNIAYAAADMKGDDAEGGRNRVAFFSLEMSSEQLATRIISEQADVRSDAIRRGAIKEEEYERIFQVSQKLHDLPLFIDDTPALSVQAMRTRARRLKRTHGLGLVIVDYLQLLTTSGAKRNDSRVQEVTEITQALKAVAKELEVPVIAVSQLSRAVEQRDDKHPQLSDLRESGSIEQDADVVMFIYREEYYRSREQPTQRDNEGDDKFAERQARHQELLAKCRNKAEVIVAKQRHGPIGTVMLQFAGEFTRFSDLAEDDRYPEQTY